MKVIFLDVDGVLNNDGYFERTKNEKQNRIELDDENIKYLKEIIGLTGAKVVVTSTWKELRIYSKLISYLKTFGIEVYDKTVHMSYNRGDEIREYLSTHEIDNFIILDDEIFRDFNELISHLVKTDFYNGGLTEQHKTLALQLLNVYLFVFRHCPKRRCHFFISITNNSNKNKAIFTRINTHILYGLFFMDIEPPFLFNQVPLIYFESRYARCTSCSILTL